MDLGIKGRKAIVCASSKGLGRACARALAEAGCAIVLNGRDREALERTARELREVARSRHAVRVGIAHSLGERPLARRLVRRPVVVGREDDDRVPLRG